MGGFRIFVVSDREKSAASVGTILVLFVCLFRSFCFVLVCHFVLQDARKMQNMHSIKSAYSVQDIKSSGNLCISVYK